MVEIQKPSLGKSGRDEHVVSKPHSASHASYLQLSSRTLLLGMQ